MLKINNVAIVTPDRLNINTVKNIRKNRLASGKLVVEKIAEKKEFTLTYNDLTGAELNVILGLLIDNEFVVLEYPAESGTATATVYCEQIPRQLWNAIDSARYYESISITLEEQ